MTQAGNFVARLPPSSCFLFYRTCSRLLSLVSDGEEECFAIANKCLSYFSSSSYFDHHHFFFEKQCSGNLNKYAFIQVRDHIHRTVRIHELFDHDSHLSALASDGNGATSPDVYASGMDTIVSTGKSIGESCFDSPLCLC